MKLFFVLILFTLYVRGNCQCQTRQSSCTLSGWKWIPKEKNPTGDKKYMFSEDSFKIQLASSNLTGVEAIDVKIDHWTSSNLGSLALWIPEARSFEITKLGKVGAWEERALKMKISDMDSKIYDLNLEVDMLEKFFFAIRSITIEYDFGKGIFNKTIITVENRNGLKTLEGNLTDSHGLAPPGVGYYRAEDETPFKINQNHVTDGDDAKINFEYWICGNGTMTIRNENNSLLTVSDTLDSKNQCVIKNGTFKNSDFGSRSGEIDMIPNLDGDETVVAILYVDINTIPNKNKSRPDMLISTQEEGFSDWTSVLVPTIEVTSEKLHIPEPNYSIFSPWIESWEVELHLRIETDSDVVMNVDVISELGDTWTIEEPFQVKLTKNELNMILLSNDNNDEIDARRIVLTFMTPVTVLSISFGDECHDDQCREKDVKATCVRLGPGKSTCNCSEFFVGDLCDMEDYCTSRHGHEICAKAGDASCEVLGSNYTCICPLHHYWDPTDPKGPTCQTFTNCSKVTSCPRGYICNEQANGTCSKCAEGFMKGEDEKCVEIKPCEKCHKINAACVIHTPDENSASIGYCYCPSGLKWDENAGKCINILGTECPALFARSANCNHGCIIEEMPNENPGLKLKCKEPVVTTTLPTTEITTETTTTTQDTTTTRLILLSGESEDLCSNKTVVEALCGQGITNCRILDEKVECKCTAGHRHTDITPNSDEPFGCQMMDPCDTLPRSKIEGQVCRINSRNLEAEWSCPPGMVIDGQLKRCVSQCSSYDNMHECSSQGKVCRENPKKNSPDCVCPPGFVEISGHCIVMQYSQVIGPLDVSVPSILEHHINGPLLRKKRDASPGMFCGSEPDPKACLELMIKAMAFVNEAGNVRRFKKLEVLEELVKNTTNLLMYDEEGYHGSEILTPQHIQVDQQGYSKVQAVLMLKKPIEISKLGSKLVNECLKETSFTNPDYCVLPGGLHLKKNQLTPSVLHQLDPCDPNLHACSDDSTCEREVVANVSTANFGCHCSKGYRVINSTEITVYRDTCEDIDECLIGIDGCPEESNCTNLPGTFLCDCPSGFSIKLLNGVKSCVDVCNGNPCVHGTCHTNKENKNSFECMCDDGWKGQMCEVEDGKVFSLRAGLISAAVILGVLLIVSVIIGRRCYTKTVAKKRCLDSIEEEERTDNFYFEMPDSNQDPQPSTRKGRFFDRQVSAISGELPKF